MFKTLLPQKAFGIFLKSQGLNAIQSNTLSIKQKALNTIRHLGYVQIDTIQVVERAHHHILWSRIPEYRPKILKELQEVDRSIFEYWTHALSYLPIEAWRIYLNDMMKVRLGKKKCYFPTTLAWKKRVLEQIKNKGPQGLSQFSQAPQKIEHLWSGKKPAKHALERLFFEGKLVIHSRNPTEKVFDLTQRVFPQVMDLVCPSRDEVFEYEALRAIRSFGVFKAEHVFYLRKKDEIAHFDRYLEKNQRRLGLIKIKINSKQWWGVEKYIENISSMDFSQAIHLLSPFDPLVIQRKRLLELTGYDFKIECYSPASKRRYGYFCLPILWVDSSKIEFIGRIDCKANRQKQMLEVLSLHPESSLFRSNIVKEALIKKLQQFSEFNSVQLKGLKKSIF